ncbi:MAG: hypothetical protein K2N83_03055, partial [Eubacterium sp.]|nr:hypothetical protein [Eubacterium sp.]
YIDVVENTVNEKNFKLDVTTTVKLNKIDCSYSILNSTLKKLIDYRLGKLEDEVRNYTFIDGSSVENSLIDPNDVIQLTYLDVDKRYYNGVSEAYMEDVGDNTSIAFVISKETATVEAVMRAVNYLNKYGKMSDSPEVKALAPTHTTFIDITSVVRSIQDLVEKNNSSAGHNNEGYDFVGDNGTTSQIDGGICSLGDTSIMCDINEKSCLQSVMIYAPINIEADIKFLNRDIDANIQIDVILNYNFNYDV